MKWAVGNRVLVKGDAGTIVDIITLNDGLLLYKIVFDNHKVGWHSEGINELS